MNSNQVSRINAISNRSAWIRGAFLILAAFVLAVTLTGGISGAAAEDEFVSYTSSRIEFDDNDNAAGLRPTYRQRYYIYYTTASGAETSSGYYSLSSPSYTNSSGFSNIRIRYFTFDATTSNNWQYYAFRGYRIEDGVLIFTFRYVAPITEMDLTLRWQDNGNAGSIRPSAENFQPQIWLSNSSSSAGNTQMASESITVTDNLDDTWTVHFDGLNFQPSNSANHYAWLTWTDASLSSGEQKYFNQAKNTGNAGSVGYMYYDLMGTDYSVTTIAKTDTTLRATITWDDMSDELGKRPAIGDFRPTLLLSSSNSYATSGYAKPVAIGENGFTVTDNGDNTWTINFTDTNVKEVYSENTNYRFLWLTWEGSDYYQNQVVDSRYFGAAYSDISNLNNIRWTVRSSIVTVRLNWQDSGNMLGLRPATADFKATAKLLLSTVSSGASSAEDVTGTDFTVTDNGDDTWTLVFYDTTARREQNVNAGKRYLFLNWTGDNSYVNESLTFSQSGVSYIDLSNYSTSTTFTYNAVPNYVSARIYWRDNGDQQSARPDPTAFQPRLLLSNSTNELTDDNSRDVTGTNYSVTDNGDNTWTILFRDTAVRSEQNIAGGWRYLWLTWDGDGRYMNEAGKTYRINGYYPYLDLNSYSTPVLPYRAFPTYAVATLTWQDQSDAAGMRPTPENFKPTLHLSNSSSAIAGDLEITTGDNYTVTDNGNGTWTVVFWDTDLHWKLTSGTRYVILTWEDTGKDSQFYANSATASSQYGFTYYGVNYSSSYAGESRLSFTAKTKMLQFRLNWNNDNSNAYSSRPDPENFVPHLWGSTSTSSAGSEEVTGSAWSVKDNGNYWVITLLDADSSVVRGLYNYFWLTWEDTSLGSAADGEAKQFYYNQAKTSSQYGYTYVSASNETYTFNAYSKLFNMRVRWQDSSDAVGLRPQPDEILWHLWFRNDNNSSTAGTMDLGGTQWNVTDNGDDTWTITFLDSDLIRQFYNGNSFAITYASRYLWITWETPETESADYYISDVLDTSFGYTRVYIYTYTSTEFSTYRFNGNTSYWTAADIYPKAVLATLAWHDDNNAFGYRPSPEDVDFHLWYSTKNNNASSGTDVTGDYTVTDNGDGTWDILFKNTQARKLAGTNTRYLVLTWDGSDQYYNTALRSTEYGFTQASISRSVTNPQFLARQKAFQILLRWEDGDNFQGYRPSTDEFVPHVWRSNANDGNKVEITGQNWTVRDNGDSTWLLSFPEPENLAETAADFTYLRLTWDGSDQYYNNVKDTSFGYMRVEATKDDPYYDLTTRPKRRELPLILNWDDYGNSRNTRPDPTSFTPHLWYEESQYIYNQGNQTVLVEIPLTREVDYQIITDQDAENKWLIRFMSLPFTYMRNNNGAMALTNISNYILTWDGSDEYYNQVLTSGTYGYMSVAANSYTPEVTTRLKDRTLDLTVRWQDYSNAGGYRPDPTQPDAFVPQLYFGSNTRTNVPIDMSEVTWEITDNGDSTWLIHFDNVPYAVSTTSGSTNTYGYYWLTWTGSDEYWNQRTSTTSSNSSYSRACMYFSRESASPVVDCYLKTRTRNIRLYWQDSQDRNGWRPTPEYLLEHMHLWMNEPGSTRCGEEIDLSTVDVVFVDTVSNANYWDIRLDHLPYYFERTSGTGSYIDYYTYCWLTWDGEHYINQSRNAYQSNTPYGTMYFPVSSSDRTTVYCYLDQSPEYTLNINWQDDYDALGYRPDPDEFEMQLLYAFDDGNPAGEIPADSFSYEVVNAYETYWVVKLYDLPHSLHNDDGSETAFRYYWLNFTDPSGKYISRLQYVYYNSSYLISRFSNEPTATSGSVSAYLNEPRITSTIKVTLTWDDNNNADGMRPAKEDFKPILGYSGQPSSTEGFDTFMAGAFENVPYTITTSGNTWTITFTEFPLAYTMSNGAQQKVNYYWFTCEDVEGYTVLNPYNSNYYSRSTTISSPSRTSSYTMTATLKRLADKDITVTLNWDDNTNEWGRRPGTGSFVPHLWAGNGSKAMREIPLTDDQWEITDAAATKWTLKLKNVENLSGGYYWLTWDGSDNYYNQFTDTNRGNYLYWAYNTANPSVTIRPRKVTITLNWQDGSNADGKRPDPNDWQPTVWYGTTSGTMEQIPLSDSDWYIRSSSGNAWTVEFYGLPDKYTNASGGQSDILYNWLTFDTSGDYYYSDRTESGYGELKWQWNQNTSLSVYTKDRPLTITLTWSDLNGQVGERPEPTPESLGAHLWYGSSGEALGEFEGLSYTVTDNGDNTWTLVFDSVPGYYTNSAGADVAVPYYWLTFDGGRGYMSNLTNTYSGTYGTMYQSKNSTNEYSMTAYCDYYRIGLTVLWSQINNIANVSHNEVDHSHTEYDLVDTVTGEVLETWAPESTADYLTHTFYLAADDNRARVDHHRYTVVQRGTPAVFWTDTQSRDYTSGVPGHSVTITNETSQVYYRFNFTFEDDGNALQLRPSALNYTAQEVGGSTYTYRSTISGISSTQDSYSTSIITLLGRDLLEGEPLQYEVDLTNLGKYYDVTYTRRVDDDGIINLDYNLRLKTQTVTLQVVWDGDHDPDKITSRPVRVEEYLMANGMNMLRENSVVFTTEDALPDDPHTWQKEMVLPTVDASGNPITWTMKQVPQATLRLYHAEQETVQEPDFGGQTVTLTNIRGDDWNYFIDLYWVSYGKGSLPDNDHIDVRNRYDIYETVSPDDDSLRKYKYELNISVNSAHYAVGDLEVRLPYYMKVVGSAGSTSWVAPLTPSNDIAVPQAPNYNPRISFNYYIDDHGTADKSDDEIVFTNWEDLTASSNSKIQVIYSLYPDEHIDTHIYDLQAHGTGYAILNYDDETHSGEREDVPEIQDSNVITFGMDTGVDIRSFTKRQSEPILLHYYDTRYINSSHFSRDAFDTDNFDYVAYQVYFSVYANQYATFHVTDLPGQNGEIVSVYSSSSGGKYMNVTGPSYSADKRIWMYTVDPTPYHSSTTYHYMYRYYWVVVAYPKSEGNIIMEDGRVFTRYTNEAEIVATALHPQNPDNMPVPPPDHNDEDVMNDATFIEWGDYRWKPSGKIFYYDKWLNKSLNSGGQTILEYEEDVTAAFNMQFYVNGDELALDGIHDYYRFNITDNELWLRGTVNGGHTDFVKLEPGDYEITSISVSITARRTDHTTGEPLPNPPLGQFVLQGQRNETGEEDGAWENIATYQWPTGNTSQSQSFSASGLTGRGYTGYRIQSPRVNEYLSISTTFYMRLNAESEKVKALIENGELLTQIELLNIAAFPMEIQEPDGSWTLYTNIYRQYDGMVAPGVPSHTDNMAVLVGLYGHDADRVPYGDEVELIYDHAVTSCGPLTSSVGSSKSATTPVADNIAEIVRVQFTLNSYQTISNYNDIPLWLREQIVINEGYFYDLLPEGWTIDPAFSVIVNRFTANTGSTTGGGAVLVGDPVVIDNYMGTNRQMVIYHVKVAGDTTNLTYYSSNGYSGFSITIGACQSFEDNGLYPRGYNIAVFQGVEYDENGNPMSDEHGYVPQVWELMHTTTNAYYDDGVFGNSVYNVERNDGQYVFYDVNGDGITNQNDVLYMNAFVNPNFARFAQTGVDKLIKGKSGVWQLHDVTDLDTDYYYWLNFRVTGAGTAHNVVIYDVLENAANTAGHMNEKFWKGTFKDIDVSAARAMGIDAKVYYSTATNLNENNNWQSVKDGAITADQVQMDFELRPDLWYPYDPATAPKDRITAIAVDLRKTLDGEDKIYEGSNNDEAYFVVTMHSPEQLPEDPEAILAYNRVYYQTILTAGGEVTEYWNINDRVTIELQDLKTVRLKKITRSDPLVNDQGQFILDEDGNYTYEEMPLGSVYFYLYKLNCTNASHTQFSQHSSPPTSYSVTGSLSNSCWTRIAVGQTQADGTTAFEDLEEGVYALREYNPYYNSSNSQYTYQIAYSDRMSSMWWSFEVNTHSPDEPVLVYRGSSSFSGSSYTDFAFGYNDSDIGEPEGEDLERRVMNSRSYQRLTIKKQWWPPLPENSGVDSIKVNVLRNGEIYLKDIELKAADNWTKVIYDLPVTSPYGTRYNYTIVETEETREALRAIGYTVVVDNNSSTSLSGRSTITFGDSTRYNYWSQERRLHNSKEDHLVLSKYVTEGGDRTKKYQFSLKLTDPESNYLSGEYGYSLYQLTESSDPESGETVSRWEWVRDGSFRLDANGTWGQLLLAHNERIVIHDLPVGTNYVLQEVGADGYVQTTTAGSLSGQIKQSAGDEDLVTNGAAITNAVEVTNTYTTDGRINLSADKTINGRLPVYFTDRTFSYYLKEVAWAQYDTAETAAEGAILEDVQDVIRTYRLNGSTRYTVNFNDNNGKGYKVTNSGNGVITFPTLLWESGVSGYKGYRVYTLREVYMTEDPETGDLVPDEQRLGYEDGMDTSVYVIWAELRDNESGMIESVVTYYKLPEGVYEVNVEEKSTWIKLNSMTGLHFNNTYKAEGDMKIRLKKTINGVAPEDGPFVRQTFRYTLAYTSVTPNPTQSAENDGSGYADFDLGLFMGDTAEEQHFTIDDVGSNQFFRYTLTEEALDEEGITIDSAVYAITIQITDKGQGRLGALLYITKDGRPVTSSNVSFDLPKEGEDTYDTVLQNLLSKTANYLGFNNKYEADGQWQPEVVKFINGVAIDTDYYKNNTFTVTLSSVDAQGRETLIGTKQTGTDGKALFDAVLYDETDINKTYTYVIHETGTSGDGVTVQDTPWTITLRVDDVGLGVLTPMILSVKKSGTEVWNSESESAQPSYVFDNTYEASGSLTIEGDKALTGRELKNGEFVFAILEENGEEAATGVSDAEGRITFGAIAYTLDDVGIHEYTVCEKKNGIAGVIYDELEWNLITTVTDLGDGTLDVVYTLNKK